MVGLLIQKAKRGSIVMIGPVNSARLEILGHGFERLEKFALLHRKCADREVDGSLVLQQQQSFQHGEGILATGKRNGHAIAFADHLEAGDGLAYFAQYGLFDFQALIITCEGAGLVGFTSASSRQDRPLHSHGDFRQSSEAKSPNQTSSTCSRWNPLA